MASIHVIIFTWFFVIIWTTFAALHTIWAIIKHPIICLKRKTRNVPPEILQNKTYGTHEYMTANGIQFHYVTAGDKSKPLMLFLHGFPEFWYSWRYQLKELQKQFHVVAVDMRGYGDSDHPPDREGYCLRNLVKDVQEMIEALGYAKCTLVAHDWGGIIAWYFANCHPNMVEKLVILNCPHPKVYVTVMRKGWSQFLKSWYIFFYQCPWLPEFTMRLADYKMLGAAFLGRKAGLRNNRAAFSPEVLEAYKYMFSQNGLTGPLNYYRKMFNSSNGKLLKKEALEMPVLIIWGDSDAFLDSELSKKEHYQELCNNIQIRNIPNCSHWVQLDYPDTVNQYITEFCIN